MSKIPCGHPEYVEGCVTCYWRTDPTEKGRAARRAWGLPEPDRATVRRLASGPCRHLGGETGRALCPSCRGHVELKVFACAAHGECTAAKPAPGVKGCCAGCPDYSRDTFRLVAPLGAGPVDYCWTGAAARKPWAYRLAVAIPHLNTPDELEACVALLQLQTVEPYVVVIDTGSPPAVCERLERMRSDALEIHFIRAHGYIHSSAAVTTAMDLAFALCRTRFLLATHSDVFMKRRDTISWLLNQCNESCPVVGWEMSPRTGPGASRWQGVVSHTCTMLHMPTIRKIGATWSMERYYETEGYPAAPTVGWPDTESGFDLCLKSAGIRPKLLGGEPNFQLHRTEWFDHARSIAGMRAFSPGSEQHRRTEAYAAVALAEALARIREWGG